MSTDIYPLFNSRTLASEQQQPIKTIKYSPILWTYYTPNKYAMIWWKQDAKVQKGYRGNVN